MTTWTRVSLSPRVSKVTDTVEAYSEPEVDKELEVAKGPAKEDVDKVCHLQEMTNHGAAAAEVDHETGVLRRTPPVWSAKATTPPASATHGAT